MLRVIESWLDGKVHSRLQHGVITQSQIWRLVPFPALAVSRAMIDVLGYPAFDLILVNLVCHGRAGHAGNRFFSLHLAAVTAHGPDFFHVLADWMDEHGAI